VLPREPTQETEPDFRAEKMPLNGTWQHVSLQAMFGAIFAEQLALKGYKIECQCSQLRKLSTDKSQTEEYLNQRKCLKT